MLQMQIDLDGLEPEAPICEYRRWVGGLGLVYCELHDARTLCHVPFCGDMLGCAYDEPDNSPEACARRLEWLKTHKGDGYDA